MWDDAEEKRIRVCEMMEWKLVRDWRVFIKKLWRNSA